MKKVKMRTLSVLIIALALVAGLALYVLRYVRSGAEWAAFSANSTLYQDGMLAVGTLTDRNGVVLAHADKSGHRYAESAHTRISCLHAVGDYEGNIGGGALSLFLEELGGYDPVGGTYDPDGNGGTVTLSLDSALCETAYDALAGRSGAVAVSNYKTGELLCMVSSPAYDPANVPELLPDGAYINRVLGASYTPGSVFKLVTLAAAIENIPDLESRRFWCEGGTTVNGSYVKCTGSHGSQTIEQAFANSCNCAFAELSLELGGETLAAYAEQFGLTQSGELEGSETAAGSFDASPAGSAALAWSGIGQSTDLVSPYGMLRLVSAAANGGNAPALTLQKGGSASQSRVMKASTAKALSDDMRYNVVSSYGEWNFPGLTLCAKSGTAEVGDGTSHAWFTGFLQDSAHPYAFVVVVEHGGGGLSAAGTVANTVLQKAVQD